MKTRIRKIVVVAALVAGGMVATQGAAFAGAPPVVDGSGGTAFLCPAAGNDTAAANNGQGWNELPSDSYTFLPGHNQAGANANSNSNNTLGPGASPGPGGGNYDWSPIWPPAP